MTSPAFHSTRWSLVTRSASSDRATAQQALGELCTTYWLPLYAFARRSGASDDDARDQVQSFCAELLQHHGLAHADRERGRFRHYLLGAFRHHVAKGYRAAAAARRGGEVTLWSLDDAETRYRVEEHERDSPEAAFERRWALALLARATDRLRAEHVAPAKQALLTALEPSLLGTDDAPQHAAVATRLGTTEGAVRVALHRLRGRLRDLIRDEVLQTLADPDQLEDELRALQQAVAGPGDG
ncbi:MAG: sigma-70 family RNA polymerase sigma factor [Planctomycetes bacterium]|jgi:RNA polymerase sigma-70 factor (ECF subfamily)|nr:sigma-70 family RNA polymerase sigma factor [Planctomycetota bacterium]